MAFSFTHSKKAAIAMINHEYLLGTILTNAKTGVFASLKSYLTEVIKLAIKIVPIAILLLVQGCDQKDSAKLIEYDGPLQEAEQIELLYTENQQIKVKMTAPLLYEFKTGDREFPKGIYLEFYNEDGILASTLKANHAYFFKTENKWRARGKVEVINQEKNEQLTTEELFWFPAKERITTESFVTIRQQSEVLYGEGLDAKQDMSTYIIKNPQGEFQIDEDHTGTSSPPPTNAAPSQETEPKKVKPLTKRKPTERFQSAE
jgi:LPS export ABC transporter protein LptC